MLSPNEFLERICVNNQPIQKKYPADSDWDLLKVLETFQNMMDIEDGKELTKYYQEIERVHDSDCSIYNEPESPNGPCDCRLSKSITPESGDNNL